MSTNQPYRRRNREGIIVEGDHRAGSTIACIVMCIAGSPEEADKIVEEWSKPTELNEKGALQEELTALVVAKVVWAIKDCDNDVKKAVEKLDGLKDKDKISDYAHFTLRWAYALRFSSGTSATWWMWRE